MKKTSDRFGELARTLGIGHGEGEAAGKAVACHAVFLKKMRTPSESVLRKNRIPKTGFDEALNGLGVVGLVSSRLLRRKRKGIWVGIIVAALVVTPGADPYTPTALFVPLILFFEASVLILDKVFKR